MINLSISRIYKKQVADDWFISPANAALEHENINPQSHDLSIIVRNDDFIKKYKLKYFGINEPTDVLSFPAGDPNPETGHIYLGDIIISYPQAEKNAVEANKMPREEIYLLVVHGVLHLLGYDHADQETQKIMWEKQEQILGSLGVIQPNGQ